MLKPFAGYAFNKAHSVCYSILAFQTAYLKANYPVEYMAALLSAYLAKDDRVTAFIEECRRLKIPVLPPDVNASEGDFSVVNVNSERAKKTVPAIRFGMVAIKGIGEGLVQGIIRERTNGAYKHLYEFADRTKAYGMNRTALEALVRAGALDSIDKNRRKLVEHVEGALQYADLQNRSRLAGQDSLFGEAASGQAEQLPKLPEFEVFSRTELLAMEKDVMGIYVSDHPLRGMERSIRENSSMACAEVADQTSELPVQLAGVVTRFRQVATKDGRKFATFSLEDFSGQASCIMYAGAYERLKDVVVKDATVVIHGTISIREMRGEKLVEVRVDRAQSLEPMENLPEPDDSVAGTVTIQLKKADRRQILRLKELILSLPGSYACLIEVLCAGKPLPIQLVNTVDPTEDFVSAVQEEFGTSSIMIERFDLSFT
jgi:DNA polymerase-3 subunit alpha